MKQQKINNRMRMIKKIPKKGYMNPEKRQEITVDLRLK